MKEYIHFKFRVLNGGVAIPFLEVNAAAKKVLLIMKLTVIILLAVILQASATSYTQKVTISKTNSSLKNVIKELRKQTDYHFIYNDDVIKNARPVTVNMVNKDINDVLKAVFKDQNLNYSMQNKILIITKKGQNNVETDVKLIDVKGKITDEKNEALPGATIRVKGTDLAVVANLNGQFSLKNLGSNAVLVISFTGYATQEVPINGQRDLSIVLKEDVGKLNEVVVLGYGSTTKRDLTGAVSKITSDELENRPVLRIDQMIQGMAAGVDVKSTSGEPGSGSTIRIRGARSINATNEPLYVIDGIIGVDDLNSINPEDVASIEVLKDASATAIYGSRASNGVILVTTKRGKSGQDKITASLNSGVTTLPNQPALLTAPQFVQFIKDARESAITDPVTLASDQQYRYINSVDLSAIGDGTNWIKESTRNAAFTNVNVSSAGGNEKLRYYVSGNYANQNGVALNSGFKRYQFRLNLDKQFKTFKFGATLNINRNELKVSQIAWGSNTEWTRSVLTLAPTIPVYQPDGSYSTFNPFAYAGGTNIDSPVAMANLIDANSVRNYLLGNFYAELTLAKGLTFRSSLGTQFNYVRNNNYSPSDLPTKIAAGTEFGSANVGISYKNYLLSENTLNYDKKIGKHTFNVLAGATYQTYTTDGLSGSANGLLSDLYEYNNLAAVDQTQKGVGSSYTKNTIASFLSRANYNFASKYYLTVTGRYDGASNFAASKKWAFFPSAAVKWRLSEEPFIKKIKAIDNLALRASYGVTGNQGINNYSSLASLATNKNSYIFGNVPNLGYTSGNLANDELTWETSRQFDIGLDVEVLNSRLALDFNYYNTQTSNLLLTVQIPTQTGYSSRLINLGATMSQGFEFGINSQNIKSKNFSWSTRLTLSTNKQSILNLGPLVKVAVADNDYGAITNYYEVGVPLGALYGAYYAGTWKSQAEIDAERAKPAGQRQYVSTNNLYTPGKMKYRDLDHNGVLDINDMPYQGSPNPSLFGGIGNTFTYKKFDLDFFINFNYGGKMYNNASFFMLTGGGAGASTNQYESYANYWNAVRNPNSDIPAPNSRDNIPSTYILQDASFLRLSSLRVGYTINHFRANWAKSIYVFFSGSNLLLISKYNNFDPEVNKAGTSSTERGRDDGTYPNTRVYSLGLNVNF